mgnify:CR=1 FL=1
MVNISTLDNGLRIVTQNMPGLETVSMGIWNFVGGRDELENINGVAHLLEHMAFKGTSTRSALQIAETIENVSPTNPAFTKSPTPDFLVLIIVTSLDFFIAIIGCRTELRT